VQTLMKPRERSPDGSADRAGVHAHQAGSGTRQLNAQDDADRQGEILARGKGYGFIVPDEGCTLWAFEPFIRKSRWLMTFGRDLPRLPRILDHRQMTKQET